MEWMQLGLLFRGLQTVEPLLLLAAIPLYEAWRAVGMPWLASKAAVTAAPGTTPEGPVPGPGAISARIVCQKSIDAAATSRVPNRVDLLLAHLSTLPNIQSLLFNGVEFTPNPTEALPVGDDVYVRVLSVTEDGKNNVSSVRFELFSRAGSMQHLMEFVNRCVDSTERRNRNRLGNHLYFFDFAADPGQDKWRQDFMVFTKHQFHSNKTFDNIFFEDKDTVLRYLKRFLDEPEWFKQRGLPRTFTLACSGEPGCGKTSVSKAMANLAHRHLINLRLARNAVTNKQFIELFASDQLTVRDRDGKLEVLHIPQNERLYIWDDPDAMNSVILRRDPALTTDPAEATPVTGALGVAGGYLPDSASANNAKFRNPDPLNLATILNVFDGTLEADGRMIQINGNMLQRLDPALLRPGRVSMLIHFGRCRALELGELVDCFWRGEKSSVRGTLSPALDRKWTPAEVIQIMMQHTGTREELVEKLATKTPRELFPFSFELTVNPDDAGNR